MAPFLVGRSKKKQVRSEVASQGYEPYKKPREGDDDLVVRAVLGRIERRWTRAINRNTMCSVDDLGELPSFTVEVTTDNAEAEYTGCYSPRLFHSESYEGDILEEYRVNRFRPSSKKKKTKKKKQKPTDQDSVLDDETAYTLDFNNAETMAKEANAEKEKAVQDLEDMIDRYLCSMHVCNCVRPELRQHSGKKDCDTHTGLGVKDFLMAKKLKGALRSRQVASENRALKSAVNGMSINDFVAWKKKTEYDGGYTVTPSERARRMKAFRPIFKEGKFGGNKGEEGKEQDLKSLASDEDYNSIETWESISTYSTLTGPMNGLPLSIVEMDVAHDMLEEFAESRGISLDALTEVLADFIFCSSSSQDSKET